MLGGSYRSGLYSAWGEEGPRRWDSKCKGSVAEQTQVSWVGAFVEEVINYFLGPSPPPRPHILEFQKGALNFLVTEWTNSLWWAALLLGVGLGLICNIKTSLADWGFYFLFAKMLWEASAIQWQNEETHLVQWEGGKLHLPFWALRLLWKLADFPLSQNSKLSNHSKMTSITIIFSCTMSLLWHLLDILHIFMFNLHSNSADWAFLLFLFWI